MGSKAATSDTCACGDFATARLVNQYCITCHNQKAKTGGLMLDTMDVSHPGANAATCQLI